MKRKSVRTAGSNRAPGKHTTTKRAWFPRGDGVGGENEFETYCEKNGLAPVRLFEPWNANEGHIALALTSRNDVLLLDGEKRYSLTPPEAMEFMADMCRESDGGVHFYGERELFQLIAAKLNGGAR